MSGIRIEDLTVSIGARPILQALSLEAHEGEFLVLLGPSGCGKSTLLGAVAGLVPVTSGRVLIGGEDVTDKDPAERHIGMVFQSYALYPTMTVERNLSFGLRVRRTPRAEIERRVRAAAELLQLTPLLGRRPAALSGGQRQRVAIGRALVREARVYLLDEPLSNLDASLRATLRRELKLLHRRLGATMIYVTHDQVEALTLATRIAVLDEGVLQQVGTPDEVYRRPANRFVAGFLGSPGMNFIDGRIARRDGCATFTGAGLEVPLDALDVTTVPDGCAVTLGIRPEHVALGSGPYAAAVRLVEPMGATRIITLDCDGTPLVSLEPGERPYADGERIPFSLDARHASLFDVSTGARI